MTLELQVPIPVDDAQCSDRNLTVGGEDDKQRMVKEMLLPKFRQPDAGVVDVVCDEPVIDDSRKTVRQYPPTLIDSGRDNLIRRTVLRRNCAAVNNETDARFNCSFNVFVTG